MKATIEGTIEEFAEMAELIAYGRAYRYSLKAPDASARDDVPNRYREEGAQ